MRTFDSRNRSRVLSQTCTSDHIQFLGKLHTQTMSISVKNYNDIRVPLVLSFLNFVGLLALSTFKTKTFTLNSIKFAAICNMRISGYQYILLMQKMVNIRVRVSGISVSIGVCSADLALVSCDTLYPYKISPPAVHGWSAEGVFTLRPVVQPVV